MSLAAGTRLGSYEVVSPLGAGGMGEVYRARDTKLDRDVAIKVLPGSVGGTAAALKRFEREAKAVAALSHPNILAIHDFGSHDGIAYAVTELLEGRTLRDRIREGPISPKQAIDLALQISRGLSAAHEKGIVHRDLKPENIFVTSDGHLKILDFGLARRDDAVLSAETGIPTASGVSEAGAVMGTVGYMSPEQVRGLPADRRSDIFSFGTVLYELLSGRNPHRRSTPYDTSSAIVKEEPPELSASGRSIPPALERIVRRCLEKEPSRRFHSAADIAFDLEELPGPSGESRLHPESARPRTGRPAMGLWPSAGIVLLLFTAAFSFVYWRSKQVRGTGESTPASTARRIAVLPFENLGGAEDGYFADGMTDEVRGRLAALPGLAVIASTSTGEYRATTKPAAQVARELDVGHLLLAKVRWQKTGSTSRIRVTAELVGPGAGPVSTTVWQETYEADLSDVFRVQGEIASKVANALEVVLSAKERGLLAVRPTSNLAAYDAFLRGTKLASGPGSDFRGAVAQLEQAVALDPGFALAWAKVSFMHSFVYSGLDPSPREAEASRNAAQRAMTLAPDLPDAHLAVAMYYRWVEGDHARALEVISRGLQIDPKADALLLRAAESEQALGRWEEALARLRQSQKIDPRSAWADLLLGRVLLQLRRGREAREVIDHGLSLAPANLYLLADKMLTFVQDGDLERARAVVAAAPKEVTPTALVAFLSGNGIDWALDDERQDLLLRLTAGSFQDDVGTWALALAQASARRSDRVKMLAHAEEARKALAAQVAQAPEHARRRMSLGLSLAYLGHKDEAVREGERAAALLPIARDAVKGPPLQYHLARIHVLCGNSSRALDILETLLNVPYTLTPGALRINPYFEPLRREPRFQRLVAGSR